MTDYTISDLSDTEREAMMRATQERLVNAIPLIVLALGIGIVLAVLFNPGNGQKIREDLANTVEDRFDEGRETASTALKRLEKEFSALRHKVEERMHDAR